MAEFGTVLLLLYLAVGASITATADAGDAAASSRNASAAPGALEFPVQSSVHAFYYLWYGEPRTDGGVYRHWNHEILPHWDPRQRDSWPTGKPFNPPHSVHCPYYPLLGPYSSRDPAVVGAHVGDLLDAGVGTLVASWWGPAWRKGTTDTQGVSTDSALDILVRELEGQPARADGGAMTLAFHLEPYPGRTVASVREDLADLHRRFGGSAALLRVGGRPVYYVYDSYRIPAAEWAQLLSPTGAATVRGTPLDGVFLGLALGPADGDTGIAPGGFDGFYTYFASEATSHASDPANWPALAAWARRAGKLFVPSVGPGYDDHRIRPWNAGSYRGREGGARYKRVWASAEAAAPDAISIVSFNEWGEGTQIEPAQPHRDPSTGEPSSDYGQEGGPYLYINITGAGAARFRHALAQRRARAGGAATAAAAAKAAAAQPAAAAAAGQAEAAAAAARAAIAPGVAPPPTPAPINAAAAAAAEAAATAAAVAAGSAAGGGSGGGGKDGGGSGNDAPRAAPGSSIPLPAGRRGGGRWFVNGSGAGGEQEKEEEL